MVWRWMRLALPGLFLPLFVFGQADTVFVDAMGLPRPREEAERFRVIQDSDSGMIVTEYDRAAHRLSSGSYTNRNCQVRNGWFTFYSPNGNKCAEGAYRLGMKTGCWLQYAGDGKSVEEQQCYRIPGKQYYCTVFQPGKPLVLREGLIDENGRKQGIWKEYFMDTPLVRRQLTYEAGNRSGLQLEFYRNGQLKRQEEIEGFGRVKGRMYDEQGRKIAYYPAFSQARPPGTLRKYLASRIPCFENLLKAGDIHYRVHIAMTGAVLDAELPGLAGNPCGLEILKALWQMPDWKPARIENRAVDHWVDAWIKYHTPRD